MRKLVMALPLLLAACASYTPAALEIDDPAQYAADVKFCVAAGKNWQSKFDAGDVAYQAAKGATSNAVGAVAGGFAVPVIGAAGGGSTAILDDLDMMGRAQANVARHCLKDKTARDHSAILADPND